MREQEHLKGEQFGLWTVVSDRRPRLELGANRYVKAQCDCGTVSWVQIGNLRNGISYSCGCVRFPCDGRKRT